MRKSTKPKHLKGNKYDQGKSPLYLIPEPALRSIADAFGYGAGKYGEYNWTGGFRWTRLASSGLRHLLSWVSGEDIDEESGLSHLAHLGANVIMLLMHEKMGLGEDDRFKFKNLQQRDNRKLSKKRGRNK